MRLNLSQIEAIIKCKNKVFGEESKIYLFGSRVDDTQKGGDIDLYLLPKNCNANIDKKISFLSILESMIGEQKIDLVIAKDEQRLIEKEAVEKGVELDLSKIKLQKYFNECDKHLQRIEEAYSDIKNILPISSFKYQNLTKDEVQGIDQYLFRFSKLQDTLGDKIFKLIIQEYNPTNEPIKFIDLLNQLEKLDFINSTNEWINLRKIRNEISHQYDDEPEEMAQAVNNILN
ncbi:MAG: hypothetical protein J7L21_02540, partial [Sulfurimonas sp.]|nr:hypothetical protein [Sulfurimonas sp.]